MRSEGITSSRVIGVAEVIPMSVEELLQGAIWSKCTNVDLEVKGNILATEFQGFNWTADLVQARREVLLLPLPKDTVQVTVVKVE